MSEFIYPDMEDALYVCERANLFIRDEGALASALADFAAHHRAVALRHLAPRPIEAFLALTTEPQSQALTDFAADVVRAFEPFRAPLSAAERARRLRAPLTARH